MRIHHYQLQAGITRTREFEKKGLATHAVNVGTKCGHNCLYCSTGAVLRTHESFRVCGENPFGFGYAIVDPNTPERVARDARRIRKRGLVQLCTLTNAWAPEALEHQLGRRCLKAILSQPDWAVRVLTKNVSVRDDFDLIEEYRDRVLVGLSITAPLDKSKSIQLIEPNASSIQDRMLAMVEAAARGLRTYAMLCPLLPGIADSQEDMYLAGHSSFATTHNFYLAVADDLVERAREAAPQALGRELVQKWCTGLSSPKSN